MNLRNQLRSGSVGVTVVKTMYTVTQADNEDLYDLILADELPLPKGEVVKLVTSPTNYSARIGDGVSVWSESMEIGHPPITTPST